MSLLETPPELKKIEALRKKLTGADPSHLAEVDRWEKKAKNALIFQSLEKHEGILMILTQAALKIKEVDEVLLAFKPKDFSPQAMAKYTYETARLFDQKELWSWFIELFGRSRDELAAVMALVEDQEPDEVTESNPQAY